jgi:hypothetical protein
MATMTNRISDTQAVKDFIAISEKYCLLIDNRCKYSNIKILQDSYVLLPQLCSCAMSLPEIKRSVSYHGEFPHSTWNIIFKTMQSKIEQRYDSYFIIDPYENNAKPLLASFSDDLSDIYRDIFPGLNDWGKVSPNVKRGIIWEWKFGYEHHWGNHATSAFKAIHFLLFSKIKDSNGDYIGLRNIG